MDHQRTHDFTQLYIALPRAHRRYGWSANAVEGNRLAEIAYVSRLIRAWRRRSGRPSEDAT